MVTRSNEASLQSSGAPSSAAAAAKLVAQISVMTLALAAAQSASSGTVHTIGFLGGPAYGGFILNPGCEIGFTGNGDYANGYRSAEMDGCYFEGYFGSVNGYASPNPVTLTGNESAYTFAFAGYVYTPCNSYIFGYSSAYFASVGPASSFNSYIGEPYYFQCWGYGS